MTTEALSQPSEADIKIFLLSTISLSVAVWDVAFNYGAFDTIFFDKVFFVWAASTAALLASLFVPPPPDRRLLVGWRGRFLLLVPTVWVVIHLISGEPLDGEPADIALSALSIVAAPAMLAKLRQTLGSQARAALRAEIDKDYTKVPKGELPGYLRRCEAID